MTQPQASGTRLLYISYNGLMEPLGQSQVWQYLQPLSDDHEITLLTFEKPGDLQDEEGFKRHKAEIEEAGIRWVPLRYHKTPSLPATLYDLGKGFYAAARLVRRQDIEAVHARGHIPAVLALYLKRTLGTRFLFDMRGFWADAWAEGGRGSTSSPVYRVLKRLERAFLAEADQIVCLTETAREVLPEMHGVDGELAPISVIPTCVNHDLFHPTDAPPDGPLTVAYVGSVGTVYRFDAVLDCFCVLREQRPEARLLVINKGQHDHIREAASERGIPSETIEVLERPHRDVPAELERAHAGIFFYKPTFSRKATSPTKLAELLACGLPCISHEAVGDVGRVLTENEAGVAISEFSTEAYEQAVDELLTLLADEGTRQRCRKTATSEFSLSSGVKAYDRIYRELAGEADEG